MTQRGLLWSTLGMLKECLGRATGDDEGPLCLSPAWSHAFLTVAADAIADVLRLMQQQ